MHNFHHSGEVNKELWIEPLGLATTDAGTPEVGPSEAFETEQSEAFEMEQIVAVLVSERGPGWVF